MFVTICVSYVTHSSPILSSALFRSIVPEDLDNLRAAHQALFPIDYEAHFYDCVINERDSIFSWAATYR